MHSIAGQLNIPNSLTLLPTIWDCTWISSAALKSAIDVTKLVISDPLEVTEVVQPEEVELFKQNAFSY